MKVWRNLAISLAAACVVAPLSSSPSSAASAGINTDIVAVGVTGTQGPNVFCGGPSYDTWSLTGVVVGTSPSAGTVSVAFYSEEGYYFVDFTLKDTSGDTLAGEGYSESGTTFVGSVTSGTGTYSSLVGEPVDLDFTVTPITTLGLQYANPLSSSDQCSSSTIAPGALVGSLQVP
jgi:hypothetical protein